MSELKPCPFCGERPIGKRSYSGITVYYICGNPNCPAGGCEVTSNTWNTRPLEDALVAERDELQGALDAIRKNIGGGTDEWFRLKAIAILEGLKDAKEAE